ncbi:MAG: biotin/lipoyl-containing protein [Anaerolineales bacterium]
MAEYSFQWGEEIVLVTIEAAEAGYSVTVGGVTRLVAATQRRPGELDLVWEDGRRLAARVASAGSQRWVALGASDHAGQAFELTVPPPASQRRRARQPGGHETLEAQMPGIVRRVLVAAGEQVVRGQTLVVLEAMKMEIRLNAPHAGTVTSVEVAEGQPVDRGQRLIGLVGTPFPP